jgi:uncharacterized coiled-coil DUF342 family protein
MAKLTINQWDAIMLKAANKMTELYDKIAELEAQVDSLTDAHAMQGESLVTIPASMVIELENKLKSQADEIDKLNNQNRKMIAALQLIKHHYIDSYTIPELRSIASDALKAG